MSDIKYLVRKNILSLVPYSSARDEFNGEDAIFLDANENPYGNLNRYPDPLQKALKKEIAVLKGVPEKNIFLGNGSDEAIDLLYRIFCVPGKDQALTFAPTYGMYSVSSAINDVGMITVPLDDNFDIPEDFDFEVTGNISLKIILLCSPNNPTGNTLSEERIIPILEKFKGIVVIDEAYTDFSCRQSFLSLLYKYPNLVVLQTFSKAWGLAAARVGMAFAGEDIISLMNKIKYPYNISAINQQAALNALKESDSVYQIITSLKVMREDMVARLKELKCVRKVYPSDANFLLVKVSDANSIYNKLVKQKIIVRNRNSVVRDCLRITIGTARENDMVIEALQKL
ncbi:MAG TPA: histidinol-phosphate transaminase [Bacteroidales bacterium]|nr:histidinol-phosphate transaminase [Bacteroidales bacterium]HPT22523.1 histidinol-phosphate transaminase [Bacteroidales bacterium]